VGYQDNYIYGNPLLDVRSLDGVSEAEAAWIECLQDGEDDPETALIKKQDREALDAFVGGLPPKVASVAEGFLEGLNQREMAALRGVTEQAVCKQARKLKRFGQRRLKALRHGIGG